uniref:NB-ARC domain-containing protein n=1 Tax=Aegilops tauschii subsp. strangulata TaxID=200361 RepID=A0A453DYK5_AEGTS
MQPKAEVRTLKHMGTSHLVEPNLVGKHTLHACKRLVERIFTHKEEKAYKVGIVGTGGVGKTTLAQKIYNAENLKEAFSNQAWICVSRDYSDITLLKELLRNFGVHHVQPEFVGCRGARANPRSMVAVAFPKLEVLVIRDLHNWEDWSLVEDATGAAATEGGEDVDAEMRMAALWRGGAGCCRFAARRGVPARGGRGELVGPDLDQGAPPACCTGATRPVGGGWIPGRQPWKVAAGEARASRGGMTWCSPYPRRTCIGDLVVLPQIGSDQRR